MIVYRICKKEEIDTILNNRNFQSVGKTCQINNKINTHSYANNKKYIHFFKDKDSIFYLDVTQDMFICTYNIPNYLLAKCYGLGFYLDKFNFKILEKVDEYAIEKEFINFDYLLKVERILEDMDIEDYLYGDDASKIETIYFNSQLINDLSNRVDFTKALNLYYILMNSNIKGSIISNLDYLIKLIPEIEYMIGFDHKNPHHHLDVWEHTLYALSLSVKDFDVRLSLLLHDIGKPFSFIERNGTRHYRNHPHVSAEMAKTILIRLGFSNEYIEKTCYLIEFHDTPITLKDIDNNYDLIYTRYLIQECDALAHNPEKLERRQEYLEKTKKLILEK